MDEFNYPGKSSIIKRITHLLNRKAPLPLDQQGNVDWGTAGQVLSTDGQGKAEWINGGGGGGDVTDVEVNGTSVVNAQGVAEVSVPTKTSDLTNDSDFITSADVPTKTSDLTNDSGFITNLVNNLANYYTKSQTYTQAEVDALISGIVTLNILVVQTLPTQDISTTTIYLVPKQDAGTSDIYDEYLYINNAWELIGTTQIDLSNYVTTTDLSTALADYVTSVDLSTILAGYAQISDLPTVNDGTLTIQQNGTTVGTFSANQSGNTTVNLTGGSTSGHTIWNRIKTALTARGKLWFADASVSDASADDATKVEVVTELASESAFDNLPTDGSADGAYVFPDSGDEYLTADMVGYGSGSVEDALDDISGQIGDIETNLSTHTVLTNSASNVTLGTNTLGVAPVTLTKGLWIIEGKVQGINAITGNSVRNEIFFSSATGTRYGLAQITLPHNSPYPVGSLTSLIYVSENLSIGIGSYFDTASQVHNVSMRATKVMDF